MRAHRIAGSVLGLIGAVVWATVLAGTPAFSARAEIELAPAIVLLFGLALAPRRRRVQSQRASGRSWAVEFWPAIAILGTACAVEVGGLLLGGHSTSVPTLSDALDALTSPTALRAIAVVIWLGAGCSHALARGGQVG